MQSVEKYLDTKYGIVLLQPAYHRYHVELGEISSYPPGYKRKMQVSSVTTIRGFRLLRQSSDAATAHGRYTLEPVLPTSRTSVKSTAPSHMSTHR